MRHSNKHKYWPHCLSEGAYYFPSSFLMLFRRNLVACSGWLLPLVWTLCRSTHHLCLFWEWAPSQHLIWRLWRSYALTRKSVSWWKRDQESLQETRKYLGDKLLSQSGVEYVQAWEEACFWRHAGLSEGCDWSFWEKSKACSELVIGTEQRECVWFECATKTD